MARRRRPAATHVTLAPQVLEALRPVFEARIRRGAGGCLIWTGQVHRGAWPRVFRDGRAWGAAHLAWMLSGRALVLGSKLWRRCPELRCVAPEHRSVQAPPWSPKRRAAEQARKSITGRSAPIDAPEPSLRWAAASVALSAASKE